MCVSVQHHGEQRIVRLNLHETRIADGKKRFEQIESVRAVFGDNIKLKQRRLILPRPGNRDRAEANRNAAEFEQVSQSPARPPMNRVVNNLAVHFLAITLAKREDL